MGSTERASEVKLWRVLVLAGVASSQLWEKSWDGARVWGLTRLTHSLVTSISRRLKGEPDPDIDIVPRNPQSTVPAPVEGPCVPGMENSNVTTLPGYALISQADVRCRLSAAGLKRATNSSLRSLESRR